MGAGLARRFRDLHAGMFEEYRRLCRAGAFRPGDRHLWRGADRGDSAAVPAVRSRSRCHAALPWSLGRDCLLLSRNLGERDVDEFYG